MVGQTSLPGVLTETIDQSYQYNLTKTIVCSGRSLVTLLFFVCSLTYSLQVTDFLNCNWLFKKVGWAEN